MGKETQNTGEEEYMKIQKKNLLDIKRNGEGCVLTETPKETKDKIERQSEERYPKESRERVDTDTRGVLMG
jgi:hypothetical protein